MPAEWGVAAEASMEVEAALEEVASEEEHQVEEASAEVVSEVPALAWGGSEVAAPVWAVSEVVLPAWEVSEAQDRAVEASELHLLLLCREVSPPRRDQDSLAQASLRHAHLLTLAEAFNRL